MKGLLTDILLEAAHLGNLDCVDYFEIAIVGVSYRLRAFGMLQHDTCPILSLELSSQAAWDIVNSRKKYIWKKAVGFASFKQYQLE